MIKKIKFEDKEFQIVGHNDFIGLQIMKFGKFYEEVALKHIRKYVKAQRVVDIGANIGNHSLFFNKIMGAEVYAFEPHPKNFKYLKINCPDVTAYQIALGEENKKVGLINPLNDMGNIKVTEGDETDMRTLDSYNFKDIDLIKIDTEGYETNILKGGIKTISKNRPVIYAEHLSLDELNNFCEIIMDMDYVLRVVTPRIHQLFGYFPKEKL
jgi:FkbM family methyltransferase